MLLSGLAAAGPPVEAGLLFVLPPAGFATLGDAARRAVPSSVPVAASSGRFACGSGPATLDWSTPAFDLVLAVDAVEIVPSDGVLSVAVEGSLGSAPGEVRVSGDCAVLEALDEVCPLQLPTTPFSAAFSVALEPSDAGGLPRFVAAPVAFTLAPIANPLSDCLLSSALGTALGQDPALLSDLVAASATPALDGLGPALEDALDGLLAGLVIREQVDVLGAPLRFDLAPTRVALGPAGLEIGLGGGLSGPEDPCAPAPAALRGAGWPDPSAPFAGTSLRPDAALHLNLDLVDSSLHSVYAAGLLCQDLGALVAREVGLSLDGPVVLNLLGPAAADLLGDDAPARLLLEPGAVPAAAAFEDAPQLGFDLGAPRLLVESALDERALIVGDLTVDLRPGLTLAAEAGALTATLDLGPVRLIEQDHSLLTPGYGAGLAGLLDTLLPTLLPAGPLFAAPLPAPLGAPVAALGFRPADDGATLAGYALLDANAVTPIAPAACTLGCEGGGPSVDPAALLGCDGAATGCDGGCSGAACAQSGAPLAAARGRLLLGAVVVFGIAVRRRSRALPLR